MQVLLKVIFAGILITVICAAFALVGVCWLAIFQMAPERNIGDLGTWVGAIGTLMALAIASWIAISNEWQRREEARIWGKTVARGLYWQVENVEAKIFGIDNQIAYSLEPQTRSEVHPGFLLDQLLAQMAKIPEIESDSIRGIAMLDSTLAGNIHLAQNIMSVTADFIRGMLDSDGDDDFFEELEFVAKEVNLAWRTLVLCREQLHKLTRNSA